MNKTVYLVTGAAGFLGSHVCDELLERGDHVRALVLPGDKAMKYVPKEVEITEGDLCDVASLERFFTLPEGDQSVVIHCASMVTTNADFNKKLMDVNVGGTKNMIDVCLKHPECQKMVYVSSTGAIPEYIANHPVYFHWWPIFTVLLGTGCRIGEALALRWDDLDFDRRVISINHSLAYYPIGEDRRSVMRISYPKTEAGIRTIPMLDSVKDAFEMLREEQLENGWNPAEIDGMSGFVFTNRFGSVPNPQSINRAIKRISADYNADEEIAAKREHRDPLLLPDFSAHHLRHTFCTRLCENETNLKVIQSIMGHKDIQTTMDIYAEATEEKKQESFERLAAKLDVF